MRITNETEVSELDSSTVISIRPKFMENVKRNVTFFKKKEPASTGSFLSDF